MEQLPMGGILVVSGTTARVVAIIKALDLEQAKSGVFQTGDYLI